MEQSAVMTRESFVLFCLFCFAFYSVQLFCCFVQFPTSPSPVLLHPSSAIPLCLPLTRSLRINYFLYTYPCQPWPSPMLRAFPSSFASAQPSFCSLRNPLFESKQTSIQQDGTISPSPFQGKPPSQPWSQTLP